MITQKSELVMVGAVVLIVVLVAGCLGSNGQKPNVDNTPVYCSVSLAPGQNMIINETQSNATICAKLNSSLSIMLGDYTRTGFNWAVTGTPGLKITDEGYTFYWYYPNWTPMTTLEASNYTGPSIQTGVNEWNVTMVNTGIQTMKGALIFPGAPPGAPINDRVFNLTIVVE